MPDQRNRPFDGSVVGAADPCPTPSQLEDLADGDSDGPGSDQPLSPHLVACAACRAAVAEIRANRRFVAGVAEVLRNVVDQRTATSSARQADHEPPFLPGYRAIDVIGHGAQAVVHRALHESSGRIVAVKSIRFGSRRQRARLAREARLAATLRHEGIVTVHDCGGLREGGFAIVMELVEGVPLGAWATGVRRGTAAPPPGEAHVDPCRRIARLFVRICDAIAHAHRNGVIHRDLKPSNVLVSADEQPRVLDFGLAQSTTDVDLDDPDSAMSLTRTGEFAGTLAYAAPEVLVGGTSRTGAPGDVYAIGVMLHEAVVGRTPHDAITTVDALVRTVVDEDVQRPVADIEGRPIDADLATIILKALAREPARRYDSPSALGRDLDNWITRRPIDARRDSLTYLTRVFVRRHRAMMATTVALLTTLVGGAIALAFLYRSAETAHADARRSASKYANQLFERNIQQAIELARAGRLGAAEELAWREALSPSLPEAVDATPTDPNFNAMLWGVRQVVSANPCLATSVVGTSNAASVVVRRLPGRDPEVVVAWSDGTITGLRCDDLEGAWSVDLPGAQPSWLPRLSVDANTGRVVACVDGRQLWSIDADDAPRMFAEAGGAGDQLRTFSFDGGTLWTCGTSGRCEQFDPVSGVQLRCVAGPPFAANCQPTDVVDGLFACAAAGRAELVVIDLGNTGEDGGDGRATEIDRLPGADVWSPDGVEPCALTPEGIVLAYRRGLELWNPRTGSVETLGERFGGVRRMLAPAAEAGPILERRRDARTMASPESGMGTDASGPIAALVLDDGGVRLIDLARSRQPVSLSGHAARNLSVCSLAWIDREALVSAGAGGVVRRWDVRPGRWRHTVRGHSESIGRLWPSPDGALLRSFGRDGTMRAWPLTLVGGGAGSTSDHRLPSVQRSTVRRLPGDSPAVRAAFSADGSLVALDDRTAPSRIVVRRTSDLALVAEHPATAHAGPLDFSPDGRWLAAGLGRDENGPVLGVCDLRDGTWRTLRASTPPSDFTRVLRFSSTGGLLAWGLSDGQLFLMASDAVACPPPIQLRGAVRSLVFSPDDTRLLTSHDDGHVVMHDRRTGEVLFDVAAHAKVASAVAWSHDGMLLASADYGGEVAIWCAATHRRCATLRVDDVPIHTIVFGAAGDRLFVGDAQGRVSEWVFGFYDEAIARSVDAWIELLRRDGIATPNAAALRTWASAWTGRTGAP